MLSKRDKLLIRPWQQRRYENHRRKVQSALPAIDNSPPLSRQHISIKLKKQQKETERIAKIEKDNMILLRKLCFIMKTNRVDNFWNSPPPNFLNRVSIYEQQRQKEIDIVDDILVEHPIHHIRKTRCSACTPKKILSPQIPEERIPWEPEKPQVSKKRSQSVPPKKSLPMVVAKKQISEKSPSAEATNQRSKSCKSNQKYRTAVDNLKSNSQSFTLSTGNLKLAVNFPSDSLLKLHDGFSERLLFSGDCYCTAMSKVC